MSVSFSNSLPAAPAGSVLGTFATDGSGRVSVSIPASAIQLTVDNVDLTAQDANIPATNLVATPSNGVYRVSAYIIVTTVDGASSTLPSVVITWTDQNNATAQTLTLTATQTGNLLTTYALGDALLSVSSAAAIQYATSGYASGTPTTMKYALHIRVEAL